MAQATPAADPGASAAALAALLGDGARWHAEYAGGLSNHLPMALVALQRLGAPAQQLHAYAERYARRLVAAPPPEPWPAEAPVAARLGDVAAWSAYRSLYAGWIARAGAAAALAQALPLLLPGCGAAAFHGLIRTAYAASTGHHAELADALAYWSCRYLDLGGPPAEGGDERDPEVLLRELRVEESSRRLIFERMRDAASAPQLHAAVRRLAVGPGTLERLARLAAHAYAASGDFTVLHLVTSAHALRVLMPFGGDAVAACRAYWLAYAAAVCAAGAAPRPAAPLRPWPSIVDAALASDDDHLIKLVDTCREQERAYGGGEWQRAASRAVVEGSSARRL